MSQNFFGIANPTILINGEVAPYVPNSLSMKRGYGDVKTRAESAGGGNVNNVVTRDLSTAIGSFTMKFYSRSETINIINNMQQQPGLNRIQAVNQDNANLNVVIAGVSVMSDPVLNFGADGEIEVEMQGLEAVIQS